MTSPRDIGREKPVGRARVRTAARLRRASSRVRGRAPRPDVSTRVFDQPDPTAAVFVDGSGQRGRRLRRAAYWLVGVALTLLALWWLSQLFVAGWSIR
jgi:hypothetical protein